ncbi:radical SAM protein [uncultured Clostridium sp.]|uniref:radical SAM protein n=1 Tax=uncultured Clostridium sp. TaxID=59620 RepID=UPI002615A5A4|nr:radical SAM protein [uncultured Clostridium sp.]
MQRYSKVLGKNEREMVMIKGFPCKWGRCTFCDYIHDNSENEKEIIKFNKEILEDITGEFGVLDVINSGSIFEVPKENLYDIKKIIDEKNIKKIFVECHWIYKNRLQEIRDIFGIEVIFRCGIETFENDFRMNFFNKGANFKDYSEVNKYFDSICLLVGVKGQTKEMIDRDIKILEKEFKLGCVNVYVENSTNLKRDEELIKWFEKKYEYLRDNPNIEGLFHNTDLGVGSEEDERK